MIEKDHKEIQAGRPDLSLSARRACFYERCMANFADSFSGKNSSLLHVISISIDVIAGKGADPKSAVGTAFSFSRPKRQATAIANISRVLQFASKRFVNSFLNL